MKPRILIVEDEPSISDNIEIALEEEGYRHVVVRTASDALNSITDIDLVVLDIGLPDRSGFEVAQEIRRTSRIPIIFLTARGSEIDRVSGLELGADDYLVKPFSIRELIARIRAVLRRTVTELNQVKRSSKNSAFQIDSERFEIFFHGVPLELSRYEFRLLKVLVDRPGRVFTREQLMSLAWEEPEMSLERTVDTHIKTIRRKLKGINPEEDPIETHRGIGYSLRQSK